MAVAGILLEAKLHSSNIIKIIFITEFLCYFSNRLKITIN